MDFACAGNIQRSLRTIFEVAGRKDALIGVNYVTTAGVQWAARQGNDLRGFLAQTGEPEWIAAAYARTPELIELFASPPLGALMDLKENGAPVLAPTFLSPEQAAWSEAVQDIILKAAPFYAAELAEELSDDLCRLLWGRLLLAPTKDEVQALGDWPLDVGLDGNARRTLAPSLEGSPSAWTKAMTAWPAGSTLRKA
jgi:hypothetical protein